MDNAKKNKLLKHINRHYKVTERADGTVSIGGHDVCVDSERKKIIPPKGVAVDDETGLNLNKEETWSSLMLLLLLLEKGYPKKSITMEKQYPSGTTHARADFYVKDPKGKNSYIIDAKKQSAFNRAITGGKKGAKQIVSYAQLQTDVSRVAYYTYFGDNRHGHRFASIDVYDIRKNSNNATEMLERWDGAYDDADFVSEENLFYRPDAKVIRHEDLKALDSDSIGKIKKEFLTALRLNTVSDKPGAFMVLVNLLLCKIYDEDIKDSSFTLESEHGEKKSVTGMMFQHFPGEETDTCLLKRLQDTFGLASEHYLGKKVIDFTDKDIDCHLGKININESSRKQLKKMFDELRLKRNNPFAFVEVNDEKTYLINAKIVTEIVRILQGYRFRYNFRQQFLGDFFEELLVTSLKQDEGQFFTPVPLVDFIVNSLPLEQIINTNLKKLPPNKAFPKVIDFACGPGHFLLSYMDRMQNILGSDKYKKMHTGAQYDWVKKDNVVGIEKDYRLARTAKVASFFNGDGEMDVITGDGINKFSCEEYTSSCLASNKTKHEYFDIVLSNPPFSVDGFKINMEMNGINESDFRLYGKGDVLTEKSSEIEIFFVERGWQLLKPGGMLVILLPQSILTADKYLGLRDFLIENFTIKAMLLTADISFFKTTTSPVTLFLQKKNGEADDDNVLFMYSPKYMNTRASKAEEEKFLGYKFSNSKDKPSIQVAESSMLSREILPILKSFLASGLSNTGPSRSRHPLCEIRPLSSVTLGQSCQIFPRYNAPKEGKPLSEYFDCVSDNESTSDSSDAFPYLEISDINKGVVSRKNNKSHKGYVCRKGDVLVSTLPTSDKICVADRGYTVTSAIMILRIKDKYKRDSAVLLERLKSDDVISQMATLTEGFKITYSKISSHSMMNYVLLSL